MGKIKNNSIPVGYQIQVQSWEGDADRYHTCTLSGLTSHEVDFIAFIVRHFRSVNAMTKPGLGNMYVHGWQLKQLIDEATVKFGVPQSQSMQYFVFDEEDEYKEDHAYSMISTLLGEVQYTGDYSGYAPDKHFCRVFDLFVVYEYEAPVKDVTKRFT